VFNDLFSDQPRNSNTKYLKYVFKIIIFPFVVLVRFYQVVLSPFMPATCRFAPTCSSYMIEANSWFVLRWILGVKRILSCHPWGKYMTQSLKKVQSLRQSISKFHI
jgi:putative membrane protein insertion efficiency factor